jgi:hypothetical protein
MISDWKEMEGRAHRKRILDHGLQVIEPLMRILSAHIF